MVLINLSFVLLIYLQAASHCYHAIICCHVPLKYWKEVSTEGYSEKVILDFFFNMFFQFRFIGKTYLCNTGLVSGS